VDTPSPANPLPPIPPPRVESELAMVTSTLRPWRGAMLTPWGVAFVAAVCFVVGGSLALNIALLAGGGRRPSPEPDPEPDSVKIDRELIPIGSEYAGRLPVACAQAWAAGAEDLGRGMPVGKALDRVADRWAKGRVEIFDGVVAPHFRDIVPESSKTLSEAQRLRLAAGWRGFAAGLNGGELPRLAPTPPTPEPKNSSSVVPVPESAKGDVQPTQVTPVEEPIEKAPKSRIESVAAVDELPKTTTVVARAAPVDAWRIRPTDQRVEDLGHYDGESFVTVKSRWRRGYEPSRQISQPVIREASPVVYEQPIYLEPSVSFSPFYPMGVSSSCASGACAR
jgi:hypothetical protein